MQNKIEITPDHIHFDIVKPESSQAKYLKLFNNSSEAFDIVKNEYKLLIFI